MNRPALNWDTVDNLADAADFAFIARLAEEIAGLSLPPCKAPMMRARLLKRLRALGLETVADYRALLDSDAGASELHELLDVLTTNVTNFYREIHHFDFLSNSILPELIAYARRGGRVRLWSAGCATGEEPVSMALDLIAACPDANDLDIRILATDINTEVLATACAALYPTTLLEPVILRHGMTDLEPDQDIADHHRISQRVRKLITYRSLNLIEPWPVSGPFQVIFCRNVLIYFSSETQNSLWPKFSNVLDNGGYLFLGHSERLEFPKRHGASPVATTTYLFD